MTRPDEWADHLDPSVPPSPALGALTPAEQEALTRISATLADGVVWSEPPAHLRSSLLDRVAAGSGTRARPGPGPGPGRSPRAVRTRRPWYLAVAASAAAAALVAVLAWPRPEVTTFAMTGVSPSGTASATAELEERSAGVAITLKIKGLKAAPAGAYYSAWMRGPDGTVPVGTFHWRKGGIPIELWSGVTPDRYPELFVTLQREGAPATPSSQIVLDGRISG